MIFLGNMAITPAERGLDTLGYLRRLRESRPSRSTLRPRKNPLGRRLFKDGLAVLTTGLLLIDSFVAGGQGLDAGIQNLRGSFSHAKNNPNDTYLETRPGIIPVDLLTQKASQLVNINMTTVGYLHELKKEVIPTWIASPDYIQPPVYGQKWRVAYTLSGSPIGEDLPNLRVVELNEIDTKKPLQVETADPNTPYRVAGILRRDLDNPTQHYIQLNYRIALTDDQAAKLLQPVY